MPGNRIAGVTLARSSGLLREMPRPVNLRPPEYGQQFDADTVFYASCRALDPAWVVLFGPPLANLEEPVVSAVRSALPADGRSINVRHLDRHSQIWVRTESDVLYFRDAPFEQQEFPVQPNLCGLFRHKRVVFTLSKDNDLAWIRDWAFFYARHHGCDAVLVYDNNSSRYRSRQISDALSGIPGMGTVVVVDWPFKFGPVGGGELPWDSNYCKFGFFEHARHSFLRLASACVNADVDELVLTRDCTSVVDKVLKSRTGYLNYVGVWVENARTGNPTSRRHRDYLHVLRDGGERAEPKWTIAPMRCPPEYQWAAHNVAELPFDAEQSQGVLYRHFRGISTNWKEARAFDERPASNHVVDAELADAMKIFDDA
jgi:hypothetical protein